MHNNINNSKLTQYNTNVAVWLQWLHDGTRSIGDVVHACFEYLAAGQDWRARYDNAAPLVDYARRWGVDDMMDANARLMPYCIRQIDSITARLADDATDAVCAQHICAMMHNDPCSVRYADVYRLLMDNWADLRWWSITYRLLAAMAAMQQWCDDDAARADLHQIITSMSAAWHD